MRMLFIADPLDHFKIHKDTTFAMMEAASARGHAIAVARARDLALEGGRVTVDASGLTLTGESDAWYRLGDCYRQPLSSFSAVVMRKRSAKTPAAVTSGPAPGPCTTSGRSR